MTTVFNPPPGGVDESEGGHQGDITDGAHGGVGHGQHPGQVIVDGLLCSIIKATSVSANDNDLIAAIVREMTETEIKASWWKLFNYYSDAWDEGRKMKVKDIKRTSNKVMIEDIGTQVKKKDIGSDLDIFVI